MEWVPLALLTAFPTKLGCVTNMDIEVIWTHIKQKIQCHCSRCTFFRFAQVVDAWWSGIVHLLGYWDQCLGWWWCCLLRPVMKVKVVLAVDGTCSLLGRQGWLDWRICLEPCLYQQRHFLVEKLEALLDVYMPSKYAYWCCFGLYDIVLHWEV